MGTFLMAIRSHFAIFYSALGMAQQTNIHAPRHRRGT
jgi:hypothetical protein